MSEYVNISELAEYTEKTPPGEYVLKLANVVPKKTKAESKPMLEAHFEVVGGDFDGNTIKQWYVLSTGVNKRGQAYSYGISDIKSLRSAVGKPFPPNYPFPLDEVKAGKELQPLLGKKLAGVVIEKENYKDKSKMDTIVKITGIVGGLKASTDEDYA